MKKKNSILIVLLGFIYILSSCNKTECLPPGSDALLIAVQDSLGNNIIEQDYPNLVLELSDGTSSHSVNSVNISDDTVEHRAWDFNIDKMISGYPYLLEYDSLNVDTLTVDWVLNSTECDGTTFYHRSIVSVLYNNSSFSSDGLHIVVE